jgi:pyruvate-formate lyase-activating enzyme
MGDSDTTDADLATRFCRLPWSYAELHADGGVFVCCPRYNDRRAIGNFFKQGLEEIWNSQQAVAFRADILSGSFAQCNHRLCPEIAGRHLPRRDALRGPERQWVEQRITRLETGPSAVKMVHDDSCNLACPSCRDRVIVARRDRQAELDRTLHGFMLPFLRDCRYLVLSGDGDPFASRHYRDILLHTRQSHPRMRIGLHTNAVLCDERAWDELGLSGRAAGVEVSVDAARPETYAVTRRGGDWERLLENLGFLARLRAAREIDMLQLSFVVQLTNVRELGEFVALGRRFGADRVAFSLIEHWGRAGDAAAYRRQRVFDPDHPEHALFLAALADPRLDDPIVMLGELHAARQRRA